MLRKFDSNRDNRITFNEFFELYSYINEEYARFLMCDANSSGTMDAIELTNLLNGRGTRVSPQAINYIVSNVEQMLQKRITFDIFCRVNARFDYLSKSYRMMQSQYGNQPFEQYLTNNFFTEFW
jgi:Ca2+-binding EF-hand superfamily protein